jgi:hypothetical protein
VSEHTNGNGRSTARILATVPERRCAVCNAEITFGKKYVPNKKYCSKRCHALRRDHAKNERIREAYDLYRYMQRSMPGVLSRLALTARKEKERKAAAE